MSEKAKLKSHKILDHIKHRLTGNQQNPANKQNTIENQLYELHWNEAIFEILNEQARLNANKSKNASCLSAHITTTIRNWYVNTTFVAIRRFLDTDEGNNSLLSLRSRFSQLAKHLTRDEYMIYHGFPTTIAEALRNAQEFEPTHVLSHTRQGVRGVSYAVPDNCSIQGTSEFLRFLDYLSGANEANRNPKDKLNDNLDNKIYSAVKKCNKLKQHCNNFITHADYKSVKNNTRIDVTYGEISDSIKQISMLIQEINLYLFGVAMQLRPISMTPYDEDIFLKLDNGLHADQYKKVWNDYWESIKLPPPPSGRLRV